MWSERTSRQSALLHDMMEQVDVDLVNAGKQPLGLQLERAVRACFFCRHGKECREWLDGSHRTRENAPEFCPNRSFFSAHRRQSTTVRHATSDPGRPIRRQVH
ncbi:DUF6455 family protein [Aquibium pacificus]|uniref:DUF6455 family protein n=1 Tax=Aquibium pacificus TaxID=3153579 RepID=UPI00349F2298